MHTTGAKAWLSGKHEPQTLQLLVFSFIRESVLCGSCSNPETSISISGKRKKRMVMLMCGACGASTPVPPTTKFAKWMAQHPPEADEVLYFAHELVSSAIIYEYNTLYKYMYNAMIIILYM